MRGWGWVRVATQEHPLAFLTGSIQGKGPGGREENVPSSWIGGSSITSLNLGFVTYKMNPDLFPFPPLAFFCTSHNQQ